MSVIVVLVTVAAALAIVGVIAFVWAARSGQMDDLDTPAVRMLHDDDESAPKDPADSPRS